MHVTCHMHARAGLIDIGFSLSEVAINGSLMPLPADDNTVAGAAAAFNLSLTDSTNWTALDAALDRAGHSGGASSGAQVPRVRVRVRVRVRAGARALVWARARVRVRVGVRLRLRVRVRVRVRVGVRVRVS